MEVDFYPIIIALTSLISVILGFSLKNKRLEINEFQEEFKRLQDRVDKLEKKNYELMEQISNLKEENAKLRGENIQLKERIDSILENHGYK